jgi:solute carrier family 25 iron transporter 28/37
MSPGKIFLLQHYMNQNSWETTASQNAEPPKTKIGGGFLLATSLSASATEEDAPSLPQASSLVRWPTVFNGVDEDITVDDWEERGEGTSLAVHMVAGSFAGLVEHVAIFPLDTIRTHAQSSRTGASRSTTASAIHLVSKRGTAFLWRGATTLAWAVVPAHAALFSTYESIMDLGLPGRHNSQDGAVDASGRDYRNSTSREQQPSYSGQRVAMVGFLAGSLSSLIHDLIMVPAETVKQRLQLGYYQNASHAIRCMAKNGGNSFYRSLPTTLAMSIPYSSLMMASNETIRWYLNPSGSYSLPTFLLAGAVSGSFAAAATTPLDVIKTKLNTQGLEMARTSTGEFHAAPREFKVRYNGFVDAYSAIARSSGIRGFFRGVGPRVLQIGPSCALSWCAYETAKKFCMESWQ